MKLPDPIPVSYDVLPEGMNIIATGVFVSEAQYYDLLEGHKRDGYTHHIRCMPMDRWWEIALVSRVVESGTGDALQKGSVLLFYCGSAESFRAWQEEFAMKLERLAVGKVSGVVN